MTQLERELKLTLKAQEELFKSELESIKTLYVNELQGMKKDYLKRMGKAMNLVDEQTSIIEKQSEVLRKYEQLSLNVQISIDEEQVQSLTDNHKALNKRLDSLEEQDKDLLEQLNNVLRKL